MQPRKNLEPTRESASHSAKQSADSETNSFFFFFDSYAIVELLAGNEAYRPYSNAAWVTTKLNLFEVATAILRSEGRKAADRFLENFNDAAIEFNRAIISEAAAFWTEKRKERVSMADSIGYALALHYNIPFLTGDKAFANLPGVRFVK